MADVMSHLTERYQLLLSSHYEGHPGRSTEDAMMVLSESIYKSWKEKKMYTAILLDVAGSFNNVNYDRLIHNLKKHHKPESIAHWIKSFLYRCSSISMGQSQNRSDQYTSRNL